MFSSVCAYACLRVCPLGSQPDVSGLIFHLRRTNNAESLSSFPLFCLYSPLSLLLFRFTKSPLNWFVLSSPPRRSFLLLSILLSLPVICSQKSCCYCGHINTCTTPCTLTVCTVNQGQVSRDRATIGVTEKKQCIVCCLQQVCLLCSRPCLLEITVIHN